jgi:hypothetical protein
MEAVEEANRWRRVRSWHRGIVYDDQDCDLWCCQNLHAKSVCYRLTPSLKLSNIRVSASITR